MTPRIRVCVQILYFLAGLTCTDNNMIQKSGAQRKASALGIALIAPDTSPRGLDTPGILLLLTVPIQALLVFLP